MAAVKSFLGGLILALALVLACPAATVPVAAVPEGPPPGTPDWYAREATNIARTAGEGQREASDPTFLPRLEAQTAANLADYNTRQAVDPDWSAFGNVCEAWQNDCAGDPFLYPGVDDFYASEGQVQPISYYDDGGARISGRVWAPKHPMPGKKYPGVVIETGSVQAPETLYWWFAETLVRNGYVVMTFDVRGQGNSDNHTPGGAQGGNIDSSVFWNGLVDAVDWFRATPTQTYTPNTTWATDAAHPLRHAGENNDFNPFHMLFDHSRLGIAGHSLGATGVSVVQGLDPWPGVIGHGQPNPVSATVAWDNLAAPGSAAPGGGSIPEYRIRTPALSSSNDYGLVVQPYTSEPDPEGKKAAFHAWEKSGTPVMQLVIQGGTHYEYSRISQFPAPFPTSNWHTWGSPFADHYSLAWMDRWLKTPAEPGYGNADSRLLEDRAWGDRMSFYFRSARSFPDRAGAQHVCQDIRAGCRDTTAAFSPPAYVPTRASAGGTTAMLPDSSRGDWRPPAVLGALLFVGALLRSRRRLWGGPRPPACRGNPAP
jgi:hypothetical protein